MNAKRAARPQEHHAQESLTRLPVDAFRVRREIEIDEDTTRLLTELASEFIFGVQAALGRTFSAAVLPPMPIASVRSETAVKPGLFAKVRNAY